MRIHLIFLLFAVVVSTSASLAQAANFDLALPDYERISGVSGNLSSIGSDTLANLMTLWAEEFNRHYPNVNIQVQAAGSATAPPALAEGTANFGPMSREMKDLELRSFESRNGYQPTAIPVAIDAVVVYVHRDNPISSLSLAQVDAIFSANRHCSDLAPIDAWGQLGLADLWERRRVQLFGRNSVSGTYGYFKEEALCGGDFKARVNEQPGSASVVQSVSTSVNGIGYSGIGYRTASVKALPLSRTSRSVAVPASLDTAINGDYPLARFLYVYVNKAPNRPLPPLEREFIRLVMSSTGQSVVVKNGYIPLPAAVVEMVLFRLGI